MSASLALLVLGLAQAVIYIVMRRFTTQAVAGPPPPLLKAIVALIGIVAVALVAGAAYLAWFVD